MRRLILVFPISFLLLAVPGPGAGPLLAAPAPLPVHSLVTGSGFPDIVKLTSIVVDESRRRAYFGASLSRYIGVIDTDTLQMTGTIDSRLDGFLSKFLRLNPGTGILYMFVIETGQLYRIDPASGSVSAPIAVGRAPAFDTATNRLYIPEPPDKIRVYDELLQPVDVITGVTAPGELFIDSAQRKLYAANAAPPPQAGVSVYSTDTKALLRRYGMPAGFDGIPKGIHVAGGKIYVNGDTIRHSLSIIDEASGAGTYIPLGENGLQMETYGGKLYQMTGYPYYAGYLPASDGSYGIIEVRDTLTGVKERDLWAGLESLYFDIDQTTGRLFYTATGRGTVGVVRLSDDTTLAKIDVATTIEDVLVHPSDGSLYLRNRLGGSTIYRVDPGSGTLVNTLDPGNWPTKILLDAGHDRLYALSHYEAKISVFDLTTDALAGTIPLGTQRARTDALSTMAMDRSLGRLYAVMPELGTLTAVNADGSGSPLTITIEGFAPNPAGGGPGKLHIAVNESLGRVFVFNTDTKRLNIYDGSTLSLLSYSIISAYSGLASPPLELLFSDDGGARLLVGPHIVDPQTGAVTGQIPSGLKVMAASPSRDRFYAWDFITSGFHERVLEYDASLQTVLRQWDLSPIMGVYSAFGFDFARDRMYVGYFDRGALDIVDLAAVPTPSYTIEAIETWVTAPNGNQVYTRLVQPVPGLYPGQRFPALIAIPGGTGAGAPLADNPGYRSLAASGFVVVVFNPEGRGTGTPGNLRSQGSEDCNGFVHQDDLKAVIEYTAGLSNVLVRNIGVETASFGIAIGAGAVGRYPDLPVAYLVDQEGPHDNRVITFYDVGRETAVCGHWSTVTDPSPANVAWWTEREAVRHIGGYRGMYLRMQAEIDHAQGPGYFRHTIEMINAATRPAYGGAGAARWTRVNGADVGNPINVVYALNEPTRYPVWVTGRLADHPGLNLAYDREMSALVDAGDFDGDGDVDADDAARFETCFTGANGGPIAPACGPGDFDADGDVDCVDWEQFALAWTQGGDPPVLSGCLAVPGPVTGLLLSAVGTSFENLRMVWNPAASAVRYVIYSDTAPGGSFTTVLASGIATTSIRVPMPPDPVLYLRVAGVNADGVEGPK